MPNRTLDVGSGGWALSAKEFATFDQLFQSSFPSAGILNPSTFPPVER